MNKKKIIIIIISVMFIFGWVYGIYKLSSMTSDNSNGNSRNIISIFIEDTLDITNKYGITNSHPDDNKLNKATILLNKPLRKVAHASVYFILSILILFTINYLFKNKKYIISSIITIILIVLLAGFDEYHQTFVNGRTGNIKDVVIDSAGGLIGILFYGTYYFVYSCGYKHGLKRNNMVE